MNLVDDVLKDLPNGGVVWALYLLVRLSLYHFRLSVFCGLRVDGFLARSDDTFDFLKPGEKQPHGFNELMGLSCGPAFIELGSITLLCRGAQH